MNRFADRRIWLKKLLGFRISDFEDTFCGLADFERSADHGFLQYFSLFEVRIAEINLVVGFSFFLPDFRTRLDYSGYQ